MKRPLRPVQSLSDRNPPSRTDFQDRGAVDGSMIEFEEVLGRVRAALTRAPAAKIQALLEGLVREQIISESYSNSFGLQRIVDRQSSRQPPALMDLLSQDHTPCLCKVFPDCAINWCSLTRVEHDPPLMDGFGHDCYCGRLHNKRKELPRSLASPHTDRGGLSEANWEQHWLEQVARRLTVPLWQNWDTGRKLLLPLIAPLEPVCATSQTELVFAPTPFGVSTEGFPLDQDSIAKGPGFSDNLNMAGLGRISHVGEGLQDTAVLERHFNMTPGELGWMSSGLESFGSVEGSAGKNRPAAHLSLKVLNLFKKHSGSFHD